MRKKTWLAALILVGVLVVIFGITSVFAQEEAVPDGEAWEEMHQACQNGDYETMARLHDQYHDGEDATPGGMMGGGMMGGGTTGRGWTGGMMGGMMGGW